MTYIFCCDILKAVMKMYFETEFIKNKKQFVTFSLDDFNWNIHFHESFEICCLISGSIEITIEGKTYTPKPGDGVIIFPRQLHCYKTTSKSKIHAVTFMPDLVPDFARAYKNLIPQSNYLPDIIKYSGFFENENPFFQKGLVYMLLGELTQCTDFAEAEVSEREQVIFKVLRFIENNYENDCSLNKAAEELSYGYTYLSRMFKACMGMSYIEYLNNYRINRAVEIIAIEKNVSVEELARRCGYTGQGSFTRNFKQFTGSTPRDTINAR